MATTTTAVTPPIDDLNPPPQPARVYYSLGRMLGAEDFTADQDYHRSSLARALLQLCGTGTVFGLKVVVTAVWQPNTLYPAMSYVLDEAQNVQVNTGVQGVSGATVTFAATPGGTALDANGIVWTNEGPINSNGWRPNAPFTMPSAIVDSNNNIQILNGPPEWEPSTSFAQWAFVYDVNGNVQVNTGAAGTSGAGLPDFAAAPGGTIDDGTGIMWTCEGPINANGWRPNTAFSAQTAIVDSNGNVQILTATTPFTTGTVGPVWNTAIGGVTQDANPAVPAWTCAGPAVNEDILEGGTNTFTAGPISPVWSTAIGSTTLDGSPTLPAWTCVGPSQSEIEVTAGLAIDRVGRMIVVPNTVCIRLQPWLNGQTASDLNDAILGGQLYIDVFVTFAACYQGVTPNFASRDDYDATDAFAANQLLDSFSMQLVLRTDAGNYPAPADMPVPVDPWQPMGAVPGGGVSTVLSNVQQNILAGQMGPAAYLPFVAGGTVPAEIPAGFDPSSVLLARITIPATPGADGAAPSLTLNQIDIDNILRLFVYPPSLVARYSGFLTGAES